MRADKPVRVLGLLFTLSACGGIAWNTTVADSPAVRQMMVNSVVPGVTTEQGFATRWGNPTQKIREGGQTEFVYRAIIDPGSRSPIQHGDSARFVIVTFQYGIAVGARSSETEGCRATFSPRPPGAGFSTPTTVRPTSACPGVLRPGASGMGTGKGVTSDDFLAEGGMSSGMGMTIDGAEMFGPPMPPSLAEEKPAVPQPVREDAYAANSPDEPK